MSTSTARSSRPLAATAVAALFVALAAGPALASHGAWSGPTQLAEPNTRWDTAAYMPQGANGAPAEKVYLNGLLLKGSPVPLGPQYELQLADGNVMGPDGYVFYALLGFWRDCNRDGYIGARNLPSSFGNFAVYPRDAYEIDETVCPLGSPYNRVSVQTGRAEPFIDEFRWIGPGAGCDAYETGCPGAPASEAGRVCVPPSQNPPTGLCASGLNTGKLVGVTNDANDVTDNLSKVWADWNHPGGQHVYSQGLYGPLVLDGKPPGTYSDSSGSLGYVDDALGREPSKALGDRWRTKPNVGACDADRAFMTGPQNGLPTGTCGAWPLYQMKRLLNDGDASGQRSREPSPLVAAFDTEKDDDGDGNPCNDGFSQQVTAPNPTGSPIQVAHVAIPDVAPAANGNVLVDGSVSGTVRNVAFAANGTRLGGTSAGRCGAALGVGGGGTGNLESDELEAEFTHRLPTETFSFRADRRSHALDAYGYDWLPQDQAGATGTVTNGPGWYGTYTWTPRPPRHGWGATTRAFATFYADVSSEAFARNGLGATPATALPSGQDAFRYGVPDGCAAVTTGPSNVNPANDWECSLDVWKAKRAVDASRDPSLATRPLIGDAFDLRDVDCSDDTVSEALGVAVGLESCSAHHQ